MASGACTGLAAVELMAFELGYPAARRNRPRRIGERSSMSGTGRIQSATAEENALTLPLTHGYQNWWLSADKESITSPECSGTRLDAEKAGTLSRL